MSQSQRSRRSDSIPTEIGECLRNARLGSWSKRAHSLSQLKQALWSALPVSLQAHCELANLRGNLLIVTAGSSVWASQLRHHADLLRTRARQLRLPIERVEVRVVPSHRRPLKSKVHRPLSTTAKQHLSNVAAQTSDDDLRAILQRIATRRSS